MYFNFFNYSFVISSCSVDQLAIPQRRFHIHSVEVRGMPFISRKFETISHTDNSAEKNHLCFCCEYQLVSENKQLRRQIKNMKV